MHWLYLCVCLKVSHKSSTILCSYQYLSVSFAIFPDLALVNIFHSGTYRFCHLTSYDHRREIFEQNKSNVNPQLKMLQNMPLN